MVDLLASSTFNIHKNNFSLHTRFYMVEQGSLVY